MSLGYTHCFYVSGGNVMHLLEAARTRMTCIAVTHEVSAAVAAEYFNVANRSNKRRAIVLVTAGPGLTNLVTGIAGAWLESRELLVIGGQARSTLLSKGAVRQVGHQEIDGVSIASSITKQAVLIEKPISGREIAQYAELTSTGRKGPVFLEVCLDVTLIEIESNDYDSTFETPSKHKTSPDSGDLDKCLDLLRFSSRPLILVGAGLSFEQFRSWIPTLEKLGIPVATTWNTCDYLDYDSPLYAGRPNTYGMRWANAVIQQADFILSIGARLGLQQTGFNVEQFAPMAKLVRVDIDSAELSRDLPKTNLKVLSDATDFFNLFMERLEKVEAEKSWVEWVAFVNTLKELLPAAEKANNIYPGYVNPFKFVTELSQLTTSSDLVIPCSSGGAYTSMMQAFQQRAGNLLTNNKGLASMGYGLAGAIGTAISSPSNRVILVEGDGGFTQNLQELGTVVNNRLNLKIFIFDNSGYASIRISQKAYFNGNYLGCDSQTGVELPEWKTLFDAWRIRAFEITDSILDIPEAMQAFNSDGPAAFILKIHIDQPFLPKITSRVNLDGSIVSNPIHLMQPPLEEEIAEVAFKFLPKEFRK